MNEVERKVDQGEQSEFDTLGFLLLLARNMRLLVGAPIAVGIMAVAVSYLVPNTYRATTKLLPPQQSQSGAAALLSQLGGVANMAAGVAGIKNPNDLYVGMLKSRTVADELIKRFDLINAYDTDSIEKARTRLEDSTTVKAGKDGLITIDVEDGDQKRVALMANAYSDALMQLTKRFAITEASQRRLFLEKQLEICKSNLAQAEIRMKQSMHTSGVSSVESDSRAIMATIGRLRAQVSAKEIEIGSLRSVMTEANPTFKLADEELRSLRAELSKLENGRPGLSGNKPVTPAGLENIKILRDVSYYEMLYELLAKQYEIARLDELKDAATIQVLDPAVEPERKFKPKRAIVGVLATLVTGLLALGWIFMKDADEKAARIPAHAARINELKAYFRVRRS